MSSNPPIEPQVFISYAHLDNLPVPGQSGWVNLFNESLSVYLGELLGKTPSIWRDDKVAGNDCITPTILTKLDKAAVIVAVISPPYINSEWCLREAKHFCQKLTGTSGEGMRFFKVLKLPISNEKESFKDEESYEFYNQSLHDLKGYEFYQNKNGRISPFRFELGEEAKQNYFAKVGDLAQDIATRIRALGPAVPEPTTDNEVVVYLAEVAGDLTVARDRIKRELTERKYKVLPDKPLPLDASAFKSAVASNLSRSRLSIHLVGSEYGDSPIGETRSIVELQNELATSRAGDPSFSRLVWIAPKPKKKYPLRLISVQQRRFIKELLDSNSDGLDELIQDSLENLKRTILDRIEAPPLTTQIRRSQHRVGSNLVYVICDTRDAKKGEQLRELLASHGCEVVLSGTGGTGADDLRLEHDNYLRICNSVLIYWGSATSFWIRLKLQDLQRIFGEGRSAPFVAKILYGGTEKTSDKESFTTNEAHYIKHFDDKITVESLSPLFQATEVEGEIA